MIISIFLSFALYLLSRLLTCVVPVVLLHILAQQRQRIIHIRVNILPVG